MIKKAGRPGSATPPLALSPPLSLPARLPAPLRWRTLHPLPRRRASRLPRAARESGASEPSASPRPFLNAVQRLVGNGTITGAEGQALDREIVGGRVDTQTLASEGFTPAQLDAVQQALGSVKQAMAATSAGAPK